LYPRPVSVPSSRAYLLVEFSLRVHVLLSRFIVLPFVPALSLLWELTNFQDKDGKLTIDEFREGSKKDPTIVQALSLYDGLV
jgi:hypothetical protein